MLPPRAGLPAGAAASQGTAPSAGPPQDGTFAQLERATSAGAKAAPAGRPALHPGQLKAYMSPSRSSRSLPRELSHMALLASSSLPGTLDDADMQPSKTPTDVSRLHQMLFQRSLHSFLLFKLSLLVAAFYLSLRAMALASGGPAQSTLDRVAAACVLAAEVLYFAAGSWLTQASLSVFQARPVDPAAVLQSQDAKRAAQAPTSIVVIIHMGDAGPTALAAAVESHVLASTKAAVRIRFLVLARSTASSTVHAARELVAAKVANVEFYSYADVQARAVRASRAEKLRRQAPGAGGSAALASVARTGSTPGSLVRASRFGSTASAAEAGEGGAGAMGETDALLLALLYVMSWPEMVNAAVVVASASLRVRLDHYRVYLAGIGPRAGLTSTVVPGAPAADVLGLGQLQQARAEVPATSKARRFGCVTCWKFMMADAATLHAALRHAEAAGWRGTGGGLQNVLTPSKTFPHVAVSASAEQSLLGKLKAVVGGWLDGAELAPSILSPTLAARNFTFVQLALDTVVSLAALHWALAPPDTLAALPSHAVLALFLLHYSLQLLVGTATAQGLAPVLATQLLARRVLAPLAAFGYAVRARASARARRRNGERGRPSDPLASCLSCSQDVDMSGGSIGVDRSAPSVAVTVCNRLDSLASVASAGTDDEALRWANPGFSATSGRGSRPGIDPGAKPGSSPGAWQLEGQQDEFGQGFRAGHKPLHGSPLGLASPVASDAGGPAAADGGRYPAAPVGLARAASPTNSVPKPLGLPPRPRSGSVRSTLAGSLPPLLNSPSSSSPQPRPVPSAHVHSSPPAAGPGPLPDLSPPAAQVHTPKPQQQHHPPHHQPHDSGSFSEDDGPLTFASFSFSSIAALDMGPRNASQASTGASHDSLDPPDSVPEDPASRSGELAQQLASMPSLAAAAGASAAVPTSPNLGALVPAHGLDSLLPPGALTLPSTPAASADGRSRRLTSASGAASGSGGSNSVRTATTLNCTIASMVPSPRAAAADAGTQTLAPMLSGSPQSAAGGRGGAVTDSIAWRPSSSDILLADTLDAHFETSSAPPAAQPVERGWQVHEGQGGGGVARTTPMGPTPAALAAMLAPLPFAAARGNVWVPPGRPDQTANPLYEGDAASVPPCSAPAAPPPAAGPGPVSPEAGPGAGAPSPLAPVWSASGRCGVDRSRPVAEHNEADVHTQPAVAPDRARPGARAPAPHAAHPAHVHPGTRAVAAASMPPLNLPGGRGCHGQPAAGVDAVSHELVSVRRTSGHDLSALSGPTGPLDPAQRQRSGTECAEAQMSGGMSDASARHLSDDSCNLPGPPGMAPVLPGLQPLAAQPPVLQERSSSVFELVPPPGEIQVAFRPHGPPGPPAPPGRPRTHLQAPALTSPPRTRPAPAPSAAPVVSLTPPAAKPAPAPFVMPLSAALSGGPPRPAALGAMGSQFSTMSVDSFERVGSEPGDRLLMSDQPSSAPTAVATAFTRSPRGTAFAVPSSGPGGAAQPAGGLPRPPPMGPLLSTQTSSLTLDSGATMPGMPYESDLCVHSAKDPTSPTNPSRANSRASSISASLVAPMDDGTPATCTSPETLSAGPSMLSSTDATTAGGPRAGSPSGAALLSQPAPRRGMFSLGRRAAEHPPLGSAAQQAPKAAGSGLSFSAARQPRSVPPEIQVAGGAVSQRQGVKQLHVVLGTLCSLVLLLTSAAAVVLGSAHMASTGKPFTTTLASCPWAAVGVLLGVHCALPQVLLLAALTLPKHVLVVTVQNSSAGLVILAVACFVVLSVPLVLFAASEL